MSAGETLIPIVFFLTIGGVISLYYLSRHKERMSMIERGLKSEEIKSLYERGTLTINPLSSLKWGIVFFCIGVAVLIGMWAHNTLMVDETIYPALITTFGGIGLILFYFVARKKINS